MKFLRYIFDRIKIFLLLFSLRLLLNPSLSQYDPKLYKNTRNRRKLERRTKNKSALVRRNLVIKMDTRYSGKRKSIYFEFIVKTDEISALVISTIAADSRHLYSPWYPIFFGRNLLKRRSRVYGNLTQAPRKSLKMGNVGKAGRKGRKRKCESQESAIARQINIFSRRNCPGGGGITKL